MTTNVSDLPARREFPREAYPGPSLIAALLLGAAMFMFMGFFGVGLLVSDSPTTSHIVFAALAALSVAMPIFGIRALFGSHIYSLIALTALGLLFFVGGFVAESIGGAPLTTFAVGPAILVLSVSAFAWWKWGTKSRHVQLGADRPGSQT